MGRQSARGPRGTTAKSPAKTPGRSQGRSTASSRGASGKGSTAEMTKLSSTGSKSAQRGGRATEGQEETRDRLYQRAAELGINGRSRMTKSELQEAISGHERSGAGGRSRSRR